MGYVSYLEDINRRLEDGLQRAESRRRNEGSGLADRNLILNLESLIKAVKIDITRIRNLQDVATNVDLDIAQELISLRSENERLSKIIKEFNAPLGNIAERYVEAVAQIERLRTMVDQDLVDEYCRIDDDLKKMTVVWRKREDALLRQESRLLKKVVHLKDDLQEKEEVVTQLTSKLTVEKNRFDILEKELTNQELISKKRIAELEESIDVLKSNIDILQTKSDDLQAELDMIRNPNDTYNRY